MRITEKNHPYLTVKYFCFFTFMSCLTEHIFSHTSSAFLILMMKARIRRVKPIKRRAVAYDFGIPYEKKFLISVEESLLLVRF